MRKSTYLSFSRSPFLSRAASPLSQRAASDFEIALPTHGGMGYAREHHIREIQIARIAPVGPQLILSYITARVLGLPKSD
jgi:hypothetical protein